MVMTRYLNTQSAVHAGADVEALRMTAEQVAADLDAAATAGERSTLARTLATVLTTLRLAEEAADKKKAAADAGPSLREVVGA